MELTNDQRHWLQSINDWTSSLNNAAIDGNADDIRKRLFWLGEAHKLATEQFATEQKAVAA